MMPQDPSPELLHLSPIYFAVSWVSPDDQLVSCASFYTQASLPLWLPVLQLPQFELCFEEPHFGLHSIQPLHQGLGACLSGFPGNHCGL